MRPQPLSTSGQASHSVSGEHLSVFGAHPRADAEHLSHTPVSPVAGRCRGSYSTSDTSRYAHRDRLVMICRLVFINAAATKSQLAHSGQCTFPAPSASTSDSAIYRHSRIIAGLWRISHDSIRLNRRRPAKEASDHGFIRFGSPSVPQGFSKLSRMFRTRTLTKSHCWSSPGSCDVEWTAALIAEIATHVSIGSSSGTDAVPFA
jgi:hypothetical protein